MARSSRPLSLLGMIGPTLFRQRARTLLTVIGVAGIVGFGGRRPGPTQPYGRSDPHGLLEDLPTIGPSFDAGTGGAVLRRIMG